MKNGAKLSLKLYKKESKPLPDWKRLFYGAIIITAITLAVSIIYLQSRSLQIQQEISHLNSQINDRETEYNNAKQEVNELSRYDRIAEIAQKAGLTVQKDNIKKVD